MFFVTRDSHRYLQDTELREEGGTAAIVESVRAGLVMQLKETIGVQAIMAREEKISRWKHMLYDQIMREGNVEICYLFCYAYFPLMV